MGKKEREEKWSQVKIYICFMCVFGGLAPYRNEVNEIKEAQIPLWSGGPQAEAGKGWVWLLKGEESGRAD